MFPELEGQFSVIYILLHSVVLFQSSSMFGVLFMTFLLSIPLVVYVFFFLDNNVNFFMVP